MAADWKKWLCLLPLAPSILAQAQTQGMNQGGDHQDLHGMFSQDIPDEFMSGSTPPSIPYESPLDEKEYIVGPGDEFLIFAGKNYNLKVSPESYLAFPGVAPIKLENLTLADAKVKIKDALGHEFKKDLVYISIRQIKLIKVGVVGEVNSPGIFSVSGNARVSEIILKAGGFSKSAQLPMVQILKRDGSKVEINIGDYYRTGNVLSNPVLQMGDRVMVPRIDLSQPKIELLMSNASYYYQLRGSKLRLGEIATEIAGFSKAFDLRAARLNSGKVLVGTELLEYSPQDGDVIEFFGKDLKIYVEGEVGKPYAYSYVPGQSIRDYMAEAGISSNSQFVGKVMVVRVDGKAETIDLSSNHLYPGDHVYVKRSGYANFKEILFVVSSIATVVISTVYLIQLSQQL
ncbi:MAG: protein involved in polysaccharide export, contains domain of the beta-grasp fold [Fibrobacteres bacterium]|nr:protein involved in polysaccharide export, contains domain of the beta-grasp fold [Fibrobacterota bacterium]